MFIWVSDNFHGKATILRPTRNNEFSASKIVFLEHRLVLPRSQHNAFFYTKLCTRIDDKNIYVFEAILRRCVVDHGARHDNRVS